LISSKGPITSGNLIPGGTMKGTLSNTQTITAVPVPAAAWLLGSGLIGLVGYGRKKLFKK